MSNWIILNSIDAGAWSGEATAINATDDLGAPVAGALVYFPQTDQALTDLIAASRVASFTADPVLRVHPEMMRVYDLPDFSIPYTVSADPADQVARLSAAIATRNVINEFLTFSAIHATTDWVLSMPTRRYSAAYNYVASTNPVTAAGAVYTTLTTPYFNSSNMTAIDKQLCVNNASSISYDQEENTAVSQGSTVIISPQPIGVTSSFYICGEASVLAFNNGESSSSSGLVTSASGTLKATVARSAIENGYVAGWSNLSTPGINNLGLPILGYEAVRAIGSNAGNIFGATLGHRTTRVNR